MFLPAFPRCSDAGAGAWRGELCSSARGRAGAHRGVVCSNARGEHLRAERRQPLHKNILPPLVQPFRIEVLEELLVRVAHVVELAFADIPIFREYLGVGKLLRDRAILDQLFLMIR